MDLTVVATPGYFATMGAEYLYLQRRAAERGPSAADYERRDTVASLSMGVGSLVAPLVLPRLLRPVTPGRGRFGTALLIGVAGAAAVTTVADLLGRLDEGEVETVGEAMPAGQAGSPAAARTAPPAAAGSPAAGRTEPPAGRKPPPAAASRTSAATGNWAAGRQVRRRIARSARKVAGVAGVVAIAGGGVVVCSTLASWTTLSRMWDRRLVRDPRHWPACAGGGRAGLGLHLLLEPPPHAREPLHVGDTRRAPFERALQPVHGAPPAGCGGVRHFCPLQFAGPVRDPTLADRLGTEHQPSLPILDPHRRNQPPRARRRGSQHALGAPGPPREQRSVPRPEPREHPRRVGPAVRHIRGRGRARRLRPDEQHQHLPSQPDRHPRAPRDVGRRGERTELAGSHLLRRARPRLVLAPERRARAGKAQRST